MHEAQHVNYIELHIGDYSAATFHLSPLEDGIYWRLLRLYYRDEGPLAADVAHVARLAGARTPEERQAVETILAEFFDLQADGWHQSRCDAELVRYRERMVEADAKREHEADRQRRHREERSALFARLREFGVVFPFDTPTSQLRTELSRVTGASHGCTSHVTNDRQDSDATATHTPDTKHQTPDKKEGTRKRAPGFDASSIDLPDWLDREAWATWCADRKDREKPITEAAAALQIKAMGEYLAAGHLPESVIEHTIAMGWTGLRAPNANAAAPAGAPRAPESFAERSERHARNRVAELTGGAAPSMHDLGDVIDIEPSLPRIAP